MKANPIEGWPPRKLKTLAMTNTNAPQESPADQRLISFTLNNRQPLYTKESRGRYPKGQGPQWGR